MAISKCTKSRHITIGPRLGCVISIGTKPNVILLNPHNPPLKIWKEKNERKKKHHEPRAPRLYAWTSHVKSTVVVLFIFFSDGSKQGTRRRRTHSFPENKNNEFRPTRNSTPIPNMLFVFPN